LLQNNLKSIEPTTQNKADQKQKGKKPLKVPWLKHYVDALNPNFAMVLDTTIATSY
jgi:hypothetical protein